VCNFQIIIVRLDKIEHQQYSIAYWWLKYLKLGLKAPYRMELFLDWMNYSRMFSFLYNLETLKQSKYIEAIIVIPVRHSWHRRCKVFHIANVNLERNNTFQKLKNKESKQELNHRIWPSIPPLPLQYLKDTIKPQY